MSPGNGILGPVMVTEPSDALKTYRYLRLAMIALVLLLAASLVIEIVAVHGYLRTSISSYYYTPARGVFVGSLVAVGVCLVVIKGNTDVEDILLNIAGCLAPVVAFVPVADPHERSSAPAALSDAAPNVANNVGSFLIVAAVCLAAATWFAKSAAGPQGMPSAVRIGLGVGGALLAVGVLWFWLGRDSLIRNGHNAAAIPLFLCMVAVTVANAYDTARQQAGADDRPMTRSDLINGYLIVAALAVVSGVVLGLVTWLAGWAHGLFWIEATQIALFAAFWGLQTRELWNVGVRVR